MEQQRTKFKTPADSRTEWMKVIQYEDINGSGRLFGGRLMEWMDEVAGIAATRHCNDYVTTAAVDNLQFKNGAYINDMVVIVAIPTYVGRTSMEVRVDVYVESREDGSRRVINRAYFTEVCVSKEGCPKPVEYGLQLVTENDRIEWDGAQKRIEVRKHRRNGGF